MSRRCHHGSPRHARQMALERRHRPGLAEPPNGEASFHAPAPFAESAGLPLAGEAMPSDAFEVSTTDVAPEPAPRANAPETGLIPPQPAIPTTREPRSREPRSAVAAAAWAPAVARAPALAPQSRPPREPQPAPGETIGGDAPERGPDGVERGATAPQLRRFIKSRAYVPMHELRRRFAINGGEDDVTPIDVERQRIYVGLPPREGGLLGELLRAGDIGFELSLDPIAPIVVGVYPMRPVPRT